MVIVYIVYAPVAAAAVKQLHITECHQTYHSQRVIMFYRSNAKSY